MYKSDCYGGRLHLQTTFIGILVLSIGLCSSFGATINWTNSSGGNWTTATNWSPNIVPGASDTANITNDGTYTVTVDGIVTVAGLAVGGGAGTQTVSIPSASLTLSGPGVMGTNTVFNLSGGTLDGTGE